MASAVRVERIDYNHVANICGLTVICCVAIVSFAYTSGPVAEQPLSTIYKDLTSTYIKVHPEAPLPSTLPSWDGLFETKDPFSEIESRVDKLSLWFVCLFIIFVLVLLSKFHF